MSLQVYTARQAFCSRQRAKPRKICESFPMTHLPTFLGGSPWLDMLLDRLRSAKVAVFGDLFLDAYWLLDSNPSETSLETGLEAGRVQAQRYSPGGCGNVAINLVALGAARVEMIGAVGTDMFGDELVRQFILRGLLVDNVLRGPLGWPTLVYAKPCKRGVELNRFDFGIGRELPADIALQLLARLESVASTCSVVVINEQVPGGWTANMVSEINALISRNPRTQFIVDSRDHAGGFPNAALKLNFREAARILGEDANVLTVDDASRLAGALEARQHHPVFVTRGEYGLVLAVNGELYDIPGIELPGAIDAVGAGDTALAALAAAFAVGAPPLQAGTLANMAAAITTRQVLTTGVATPAQLRALGPAPITCMHPGSRRNGAWPVIYRARTSKSSPATAYGAHSPRNFRPRRYDLTLRQGWEEVMEPMMIEAILGPRLTDIDDATMPGSSHVRAFIDRTTGIQTLAQMKGLIDLVHEFGLVTPGTSATNSATRRFSMRRCLR